MEEVSHVLSAHGDSIYIMIKTFADNRDTSTQIRTSNEFCNDFAGVIFF
jgi:hypothetical protein